MNYIEFAEQGQRVYNRNVFLEPENNIDSNLKLINYLDGLHWFLNNKINEYKERLKANSKKDTIRNTEIPSNIPIFDFRDKVGIAYFPGNLSNANNNRDNTSSNIISSI